MPLDLQEEGFTATVAGLVSGGASTIQAADEAAQGAGAGALLLGGMTFAATKNPALARTAAQAGAKAGGLAGAADYTFKLETGSTFRESESWTGSDGKPLSRQERAGAALLVGAANTGIELLEFAAIKAALTPAAAGLTLEGGASLRLAIARDPSWRAALVRVAKTWAKATAPEVLEEGAQDLTRQVAKSVAGGRNELDASPVLESMGQALPVVAFGFGLPVGVFQLGVESVARMENAKSAGTVAPLLALAADPDMVKNPGEFEQLSGGATAYVRGEAVKRFFQERSDDVSEQAAQANELLGPGAAARIEEAAMSGGSIEIPAAQLPAWAASEAGAALADDTSTHPERWTPREMKAGGAALEAEAMAKADAYLAQQADAVAFDETVAAWREQQVAAGMTKADAKVGALVLRHLVATAAKDSGKSPMELLGNAEIVFAPGDEAAIGSPGAPTAPSAPGAPQGERLNQQNDWVPGIVAAAQEIEQRPEGRVRAAFFDTLTGLRNRRGFDTEHQAGTGVVVALTSTDSKPINDKVSHTQTDRLFRTIGGLVSGVDQKAARDGTTFLFRAESPEVARTAVESWRAQLPPNLALSLGFGEDSSAAMADVEDQVDTGRAKGRVAEQAAAAPTDAELLAEFPDAPALPSDRLGTKLDLQALKLDEGAAVTSALTPELQQAAESRFTSTGDFARDQFLDQHTGGLILNGRGFEAAGPRAYVAAFDGIGLKSLNETFTQMGREKFGMSRRRAKAWGRVMGDYMLRAIADAAHGIGGAGVSFARKSGDEFAAKHDNLAELKQFTADLLAELKATPLQIPDGSTFMMPVGARWGIGEKTYEAADIDLNRRKADVAAGGSGGASDLPGSASADERTGRAYTRGILDPSRLDLQAEARGVSSAALGERADAAGDSGDADAQVEQGAGEGAPGDGASAGRVAEFRAQLDGAERDEFDRVVAERSARGELRHDEPELLRAGLNSAANVESARALVDARPEGDWKSAATARLDWVENKSQSRVHTEAGESVNVPDSTWVEVDAWLRTRPRDIVDPEHGLRDLKWRAENPGKAPPWSTGPRIGGSSKWTDKGMQTRADAQSDRRRHQPPLERDFPSVKATMPATIYEMSLAAARRRLQWSRLARAMAEKPVSFDAFGGGKVTVTPVRGGIGGAREGMRWRATWFDKDGEPGGHSDRATHREAVEMAREYGGNPDSAQKPTLLRQDATGATPRGYFESPEATAAKRVYRVFLNKSADVSTVLHESAHAWLELYRSLAAAPDATDTVKAKWADVAKWLGVEGEARLTTEQHERFARTFEAYLLEGKAPKKELVKAFDALKRWLVSLYRTAAGIPGAGLNDEARRVFDSLLATEAEVTAYLKAQGRDAIADAKTAEVTEAEWQARLEVEHQAVSEGSRRLELRALKDAQRVHEKWWKDGVKKLRAVFAQEFEQLPGVRAKRMLKETGLEFDPFDLPENAGDIATAFGFASPGDLVTAIAEVPDKAAWVNAHAEAEMAANHPGILERREELTKLLSDDLAGYTERRLLDERLALSKRAGVAGAPASMLRRQAEIIVSKTLLGKLAPGQALARMRNAASRAFDAAAKGRWDDAAKAMSERLLNHYLHRELLAAIEARTKLESDAKDVSTVAARAKLGKASTLYRDAVDFLLASFGLAAPADATLTAASLQQAVGQLQGDAVVVGDPDWLAPVLELVDGVDNHKKLTVAQAAQVQNALDMLRAGARGRNETLLDDKRVDAEEVRAGALEDIASTVPDRGSLVQQHAMTRTEKLKERANAFDGFLVSPIDMVRDLVGDNQQSTLWRAIVNPLRRAVHREADLLRESVKPIVDAFDSMTPAMRRRLSDTIDGAKLFPSHIDNFVPRRRYELLMLALNVGSRTSIDAVTQGRNITMEQVKAALDLLTPEEVALANAVVKAAESLREPAFALEERVTGLRPKAVTAIPLVLKGGTLTGGYFPLKAIKEGSNAGQKMAAGEMADLFDPSFTRPVTAHGHLKARTGAVYPVSLDPGAIMKHLGAVVHDIAFREPVRSVAGLVMHADINAALQRRVGVPKAAEFLKWLKDIGGGSGGMADSAVSSFMSTIKANMATSLLSGLSTAVGNFANLPAAITSTKLKTKHLSAAIGALATDFGATIDKAREQSGTLRAMQNDYVGGLQKELKSLTATPFEQSTAWMREAGMAAMSTVDTLVSTAVWVGAHRQAIAEGMEAGAAVRWADDILTQVQPQSSAVERAGILRDKGWAGALALFYGYLSVAYRAQHRIASPLFTKQFRNATPAQKAVMAGAVAGSMLGFYIAFGPSGELGMGRGPEDADRDDDEPDNELLKWRNWLLRKLAAAPFSTIPILPLGSIVDSAIAGKVVTPRADPLSGVVLQLGKTAMAAGKLAKGEGDASRASSEALRSIGVLTGLPTRAIDTTGRYLWEVSTGTRDVPNAGRFVGGVLYGERDKQPDNVPTLIGEWGAR
jgi:GGDEF domain-containing protein